jgi:hypothetical protein
MKLKYYAKASHISMQSTLNSFIAGSLAINYKGL